ncbi:Ger(x)C family germination protein [Anoxybacillus kamchatkensis]|uniref:Ger(x)C family spore germination protein n=1 Tax=Anoxybacillus ayderensis TaxID=265546 RepID=UPI0015EBEE9B|nr:Ger(x)C family spore germination protein [Anoxybacillus ayderensis]MBA2879244.1 Ger(x)C family germination protein [Anoxybacillus ayderensis]
MRTSLFFFIIFSLSLLLNGCWNIKEIQDINYVTAIGIDFNEEKKEFVVFAQVLDFSNVAKLEGGFPEKSPPIWIGKRNGKTIQEAIDALTKEAQQRLFWGHISAIVLSERVLKTNLKQAIDFVNRYREVRYNIWLFSTREKIDRIFQAKSFFKLSALSNILHEPNELYRQYSVIRPVRFFEYLADASTTKKTVYIPSLSLSTKTWQSDNQRKPLLKISGAHFLIDHHLQGWLSESKLLGMRWLDQKMEKSSVIVIENDEPLASVTVENLRISMRTKGKQIFLHISGKGIMNEKIKEISLKKIKHKTESIIEGEIWNTYREGLNIYADVLNVNEWLDKNKIVGGKTIIFPYEMADVSVHINIISTGKLKNS